MTISKWLIGIIVSVLLTMVPMGVLIIYNQGKQSEKIDYIYRAVELVLDKLPKMDITLANHDVRIIHIERELYDGQEAKQKQN